MGIQQESIANRSVLSLQGSYSKEGRAPDHGYNASPAFLAMTLHFLWGMLAHLKCRRMGKFNAKVVYIII